MRFRRLRLTPCLFMACAFLAAGCTEGDGVGASKGLKGARVAATPENANALAEQLVAEMNAVRVSRGLKPFRVSPELTKIAAAYAERMIVGGFFDHIDPSTGHNPIERALQAGYLHIALGENLAAVTTNPHEVVEAWMESNAGHREMILSEHFEEVGVAVRTGGDYGIYWVAEFATR